MPQILTIKPEYSQAQAPPVISKTQLAKELNLNRNTLLSYHRLAQSSIPKYQEYCRGTNGRLTSRLPLNQYQARVISAIAKLAKQYRSNTLIIRELKANLTTYENI